MELLFWLLAGHAVADYPLQGDFLAKGKNHRHPLPGVPWWQCLAAHAFIHGAAVALATGSVLAGICEIVLHGLIDFGKSQGWYGFNTDQALHVGCKLWYAILLGAFRG